MTKLWKAIRENWGIGIFVVDTFAALMTLLFKITGHYINFTAPAHYLWRGADPYGVTFPGSPGAFFYSPGCALFFYGLFAFLPPTVGQFLYMLLSVVVYVWGLRLLVDALAQKQVFDLRSSPLRNLFWLMIASELLGGIIAVKIDVLMVGGALASVGCLIRGRGALPVLFAMGILTSFKIHPISLFGLLLVPYLLDRKWKEPLTYAAGLALGLLSPMLVFSPSMTLHLTHQWLGTLKEFTTHQWLAPIFQHIYGFLFRAFGWPMDVGVTTSITAAVGLIFALIVASVYQREKKLAPATALSWTLLTALGLGSSFTAVFSQLIQSNSYVVYTPLVLTVIAWSTRAHRQKKQTAILLLICFIIISLAYSDFNPRKFYWLVYGWGIKPLGVITLTIALLTSIQKVLGKSNSPNSRRSQTLDFSQK
jgi:hypothetical protein